MDAAIFGLIVADIIARPMDLRTPPRPGILLVLDNLEVTTGGNVCNVGLAMAKLGMNVAGAGMVGDDILGTACVARLKAGGMDTSHVFADRRAQTSATVVAVESSGERCFFHSRGATNLLDPGALRRCFSIFAQCSYVHIGYFGLLPNLTPELGGLLKEMRTVLPNTKIALDTSDPPEDERYLWPILPHLDVFCPSRSEAQVLSGQREPKKMIEVFRRHMPSGLIGIKLDAEGCILDDGREQVTAPAYSIDCIDTTGAGDSWYAGVLTALTRKMPLQQAAKLANRVAADCCTALGASAGIRSFEETMARM